MQSKAGTAVLHEVFHRRRNVDQCAQRVQSSSWHRHSVIQDDCSPYVGANGSTRKIELQVVTGHTRERMSISEKLGQSLEEITANRRPAGRGAGRARAAPAAPPLAHGAHALAGRAARLRDRLRAARRRLGPGPGREPRRPRLHRELTPA